MKDVLFLVHRAPYPPDKGDRIRAYHILRHLAQRCNVHLACLADEPIASQSLAALRQHTASLAVVENSSPLRWARAAWSMARGQSATEGLFASVELRRLVDEWAQSTRFDAVLVYCSSMVQYLAAAGLRDVPVVVDLVDVDSQKWFDYAAADHGLKRPLFRLEGRLVRRIERCLPQQVRAVTLVSQAEADLYRSFCPNSLTLTVPNGVDLDYFQPSTKSDGGAGNEPGADAELRCAFVGAMDYRANVDGVCWFVEHVWPEVRRCQPAACFQIVGRRPSPAVRSLESVPGVKVVGEVPDVRPYLQAATVVVAPLRIARGIQNKVLEAMAMAKPVVCSPAALKGIIATPGREVLVAATPADWTQLLNRLLSSRPLRQQLAAAARRHVEQHYTWSAALGPLIDCLDLRPYSNTRPAGDSPPASSAA